MSGSTCIACQATFSTADEQRGHYRTDWHRYNLKRRVAGAAPVGEEEFRDRVDAQQQRTRAEAGKAAFQKECAACGKTYFSENAYNSHLLSKRHRDLEAAAGTAEAAQADGEEEDAAMAEDSGTPQEPRQTNWRSALASAADEDEVDAILAEKRRTAPRLAPEACLFCPLSSTTPEANVEHMSREHSFFIPSLTNLADLPGLLRTLADAVTVDNLCLYCGFSGRKMHSVEAVRKHMLDKGHARLGEDLEEMCEEFYEFEDDAGEGMEVDFFNGRTDKPYVGDDQHLHLPSGAVAAPRSLARYYKQNLVPSGNSAMHRILHGYKALGYAEEPEEVVRKRRAQRAEARGRARWESAMGERGNGLQKHFRVQIPF
ncbi:C2H2 type zinc-finger-domain-containing protein [Hyaloraphidium curvatum]|nr:C2H2 type zinc-finger-domain-containing protein [Hyaloraphidium curvatum]